MPSQIELIWFFSLTDPVVAFNSWRWSFRLSVNNDLNKFLVLNLITDQKVESESEYPDLEIPYFATLNQTIHFTFVQGFRSKIGLNPPWSRSFQIIKSRLPML